MGTMDAERSSEMSNHGVKERLFAELHRRSLDEAIRLIESEKARKLTDRHLHSIAEYEAIRIDDETFFEKAFSSGKEVAACLAFAMEIGWQEVLEDMVRLRSTLTVSGANAVAMSVSDHMDTSASTPANSSGNVPALDRSAIATR